MGNQIIKQPNGLFAIFSSITDTIIVWDASERAGDHRLVRRTGSPGRPREGGETAWPRRG